MRIVVEVVDSTELMSKEEVRAHISYLRSQIEDIETCIRELEEE